MTGKKAPISHDGRAHELRTAATNSETAPILLFIALFCRSLIVCLSFAAQVLVNALTGQVQSNEDHLSGNPTYQASGITSE
jgi:hypothetical protein